MEGPQTRALAEHLNETITGKPVMRILVPENRWQANVLMLNCVGHVIQRVRSHGKWLFFDFSHGITWLCQLITKAKWTVVTEETKTKKRALITLHLQRGMTAVLTGRPIIYILPSDKVTSHPEVKAMGPDPLSTETFQDDFPYRLRQLPHRTLAAALLDQEVVAGIGNILKCEILHALRFSPTLRVGAMFSSQIDSLAGTLVELLTTAATFAVQGKAYPYRVYDRAGLPCETCGTEITADRSGQDGRLTWYCRTCQALGREPTLFQP